MADVVICSSGGDHRAAEALRRAVSSTRLSVWWDDAPSDDFWRSDDVVERIRSAKAAVVIWSRHSVASAPFRAEANAARQQKKLIQVSADGEGPPPPFDRAHVADISDWRGQIRHPGWQQIIAELEELTGAAVRGAKPWKRPVLPFLSVRPRAGSAGEVINSPSNPGVSLAALRPASAFAPLLIALVIAAAVTGWMADLASNAPTGRPMAAAVTASAPAIARARVARPEKGRPEKAAPAATGRASGAPPPIRLAAAREKPAPAKAQSNSIARRQPAARARSKITTRAREKAPTSSRSKPSVTARTTRPKIKYRYSETMRLFCQRSGKTTPECRIFRRNAPRAKR